MNCCLCPLARTCLFLSFLYLWISSFCFLYWLNCYFLCKEKREKKKEMLKLNVETTESWSYETPLVFSWFKKELSATVCFFFYLFVCFYNNSNIFSCGRRFLTDVISLFPQTVKVKNDRKFVLFSFLWGLTFFRFLALQKKNNDIYVASRLIFSALKCLQTSSEE